MCASVIISNTPSVTASDAKYRGFIEDEIFEICHAGGLSENFDIQGLFRPKSAIPGVYRILT